MVRIEDISESDIRSREKHTTLVGIAKELFGEKSVVSDPRLSHAFWCQSDKIMVYITVKNQIIVSDRAYLEDAVKLAREYERRTEEDWTVKRDYIK